MDSSHSSEQKKFLLSSWPYLPGVVIYADFGLFGSCGLKRNLLSAVLPLHDYPNRPLENFASVFVNRLPI
jgi:hypothetical protein